MQSMYQAWVLALLLMGLTQVVQVNCMALEVAECPLLAEVARAKCPYKQCVELQSCLEDHYQDNGFQCSKQVIRYVFRNNLDSSWCGDCRDNYRDVTEKELAFVSGCMSTETAQYLIETGKSSTLIPVKDHGAAMKTVSAKLIDCVAKVSGDSKTMARHYLTAFVCVKRDGFEPGLIL